MMIYKVKYEHDNGYRKEDKIAIITSECALKNNLEVKDFFYHYIYRDGDDFVKIYEYEPIWNNDGNYIILEKVVD